MYKIEKSLKKKDYCISSQHGFSNTEKRPCTKIQKAH